MPYAVYLKKSAEKDLDSLPREVHQKIIKRLLSLKGNPPGPLGPRSYGAARDIK